MTFCTNIHHRNKIDIIGLVKKIIICEFRLQYEKSKASLKKSSEQADNMTLIERHKEGKFGLSICPFLY